MNSPSLVRSRIGGTSIFEIVGLRQVVSGKNSKYPTGGTRANPRQCSICQPGLPTDKEAGILESIQCEQIPEGLIFSFPRCTSTSSLLDIPVILSMNETFTALKPKKLHFLFRPSAGPR